MIAASALLAKYGLKPRELEETNILTPETEEDRLCSDEVQPNPIPNTNWTLSLALTLAACSPRR